MAGAEAYKKEIEIPLIPVDGIGSYAAAASLVGSGMADYISLSRPLIREPGRINSWNAQGSGRSQCISDNGCLASARKGEGVRCVRPL
jgi:2,4-dienoyl-CoA reductase-like NADH-dependent reductase (Old Yellow Enzyme family)